MRPRSIGRRLAFQYLFMADLQRFEGVEGPHDFFRTQRAAARDTDDDAPAQAFKFDDPDPRRDEAESFAFSLIETTRKRMLDIDASIGRAAHNWSVARMGPVERNIIRLATAEILLGDTPPGVIMDEAVELAKRFGSLESGAFVNGVIDRIGKD